jgi:hypothetical protein
VGIFNSAWICHYFYILGATRDDSHVDSGLWKMAIAQLVVYFCDIVLILSGCFFITKTREQ